jgi:hypothetical protein
MREFPFQSKWSHILICSWGHFANGIYYKKFQIQTQDYNALYVVEKMERSRTSIHQPNGNQRRLLFYGEWHFQRMSF